MNDMLFCAGVAIVACLIMIVGIIVSLVGALGFANMNCTVAGVGVIFVGGVINLVACLCIIHMYYGVNFVPFFFI